MLEWPSVIGRPIEEILSDAFIKVVELIARQMENWEDK